MRKLKKSELKRVYGGAHTNGQGANEGRHASGDPGTAVSSDTPGGTSGDVSV